jgi:hypothetical protein
MLGTLDIGAHISSNGEENLLQPSGDETTNSEKELTEDLDQEVEEILEGPMMGNVTQKDNSVRYSMVGAQDLGKEPFVMVKQEKNTDSQEHEKKDDSKIYSSI